MLVSLVQLLAGIGVLLFLLSWYPDTPDTLAIVTGLMGAFAWGLVAYGLLNLETTGGATASEPALALFATAGVVVTVLPALVNPVELIGEKAESDDPFGEL